MDSLFSRIQKTNPSEKLDIQLELYNQQKTPSGAVLHILKEPIPVMSGKVVVKNTGNTSITIKKLSVVLLTGEGYTGHQLDVDPETADVKPLFARPLRRNGVILWEKGKKILPGRHEFPFKVTFPASVPPTLKFADAEKCITHIVHVCARLAKEELIIKASEVHINRLAVTSEAKQVTKAGLASGGKIYCTLSTTDYIWIDEEVEIGKLVLATADKATPQVYLKRVDCKLVEKVTRNTDAEPKITEKQSGPTVTYHIETENCEIDSSPSKELGISFPFDSEMQPDYAQENMALAHEVEFQLHFSTSLMANTNLIAKIRVPAVLCYKYSSEPVRRDSLQISDAGSFHERQSLDVYSPRSSIDEFRTAHSNRSLTSISSILKPKSSKRSGVFSFASFFKKEKSMPEVKTKVSFKNTSRKAVDYSSADHGSDSDSSLDMHPEIRAKDSMMKLKRSNSEFVKPKVSMEIQQLHRSNSNPNSLGRSTSKNSFAELYNRLESITDKYEENAKKEREGLERPSTPLGLYADPIDADNESLASKEKEVEPAPESRDEQHVSYETSDYKDYDNHEEEYPPNDDNDRYESNAHYDDYEAQRYEREEEFHIHSVEVYEEKMPSARIEELDQEELIEEPEDEEARYNEVYGIPEPNVVQQYENSNARPTSVSLVENDVFSHGSDIPPSLLSKDGNNFRDFGDGLYSDINDSKPNLQIVTNSRNAPEPAPIESPNDFDSMDIKRQSYASTIYSELSPFVQSAPIITGRELPPKLESPMSPQREKPFIQSAPIVIGGKDSNQHIDSPNSPTLQTLRSLELKKGVIRGPKIHDYRKTPGSPLAVAHSMPSPLPNPDLQPIESPMINENQYQDYNEQNEDYVERNDENVDYPTRAATPQNESYQPITRPVTPQDFLNRPPTPQNENFRPSSPSMTRTTSSRTPPSHTPIEIPNEPTTPSSKSQTTIPSQNTLTEKIPPRPSSLLPVFSAKTTYHPSRPDELLIKAGQLCQIKEIVHEGWAYGLNMQTGKQGIFPMLVFDVQLTRQELHQYYGKATKIEKVQVSSPLITCICTQRYIPQNETELETFPNDKVTLMVDYGNGWAYGKIRDMEGAIMTKGLHCQGIPYLVKYKNSPILMSNLVQ